MTDTCHSVTSGARVLVLAGTTVGVIVIGIGGRLAMFVLRVTSSDHVRGATSDDGFVIGRFTLSGTYNLLMLGAAVGIVGAAIFRCVRPWLLGPGWFRTGTVALATGAVGGSMLLHADGIDFTLLGPTWLAIALFVALPTIFGGAICWTVERVGRDGQATEATSYWALPAMLVVGFPATAVVLVPTVAVLSAWTAIRDRRVIRVMASSTPVGLILRAAWLAIALLGLIALLDDIAEIGAAT